MKVCTRSYAASQIFRGFIILRKIRESCGSKLNAELSKQQNTNVDGAEKERMKSGKTAGKMKRKANRGTGFKYAVSKIVQFAATLFVLSLVVFVISRIAPGDPLRAFYGEAVERMSAEQLADARTRLGLDESIFTQYINWLSSAFYGDFGISFKYKQSVTEVVSGVYMNTLILTLISFIIIFTAGIFIAVFCVLREGSLADRLICRIGVALGSMPEFFVALILVLIFAVNLGIFPSSGAYAIGQSENIADRLYHLVLPVMSIVISHIWYCTYLIRNKLSEELRQEYVLLCRVKGLTQRRIIYKHCLKNAMPAIVSIMAIFLPHLLGGTYVVETVFSYPGLGILGFESAQYHDYNMLMVISLITGFFVVAANMAARIINERIDPRTEYGETVYGAENTGGTYEK